MKRWNVVLPEHTLVLYYKDLETAKEKWPDALSIMENADSAYLEYIDRIKSAAVEILNDHKGRRIYKIPYNSAYILVRLYLDNENGVNFFYDYCEFQRHDECTLIPQVLWTTSTPEEFYKYFLADNCPVDMPVEVISLRELKKLKPVKFYNKNNYTYYKDCNGYFYIAEKWYFLKKEYRDEYNKLMGNKDAVRARIYRFDYDYKDKWFSSEEELVQEYEEMKRNTPPAYPKPYYNIKQRGYSLKAPEDIKFIQRLPYFRLDIEVEYERNEGTNEKTIPQHVAPKWCGMMEGYKQFEDLLSNIDLVADLILRWNEYLINSFKKKIEESTMIQPLLFEAVF